MILSQFFFQVEASAVTTVSDDGVFKVTMGPAPTNVQNLDSSEITTDAVNTFTPCPRMSCGLVIKHGVLYMYGGMAEDGDRRFTFNDFYALGKSCM